MYFRASGKLPNEGILRISKVAKKKYKNEGCCFSCFHTFCVEISIQIYLLFIEKPLLGLGFYERQNG